MKGISRDNDSAGGDLEPSQFTVFANGEEVIIDGDVVGGHGPLPHIPQNIVAGSNNVFVADKPVVNEGDPASVCGEPATGSSNVFVGD